MSHDKVSVLHFVEFLCRLDSCNDHLVLQVRKNNRCQKYCRCASRSVAIILFTRTETQVRDYIEVSPGVTVEIENQGLLASHTSASGGTQQDVLHEEQQ